MDDTLTGLQKPWVDFLNEKYATNVCTDDITEWDISKFFPTLTKMQIFGALQDEKLWQAVRPLPGAVKYLKRLKDDGHVVLVVTSAPPDTVCNKTRVLFKYFPYLSYQDVIITSHKQLIAGDVLIDDAPHNHAEGGRLGILMSCTHNRAYDSIRNGLIRATDWEEVYKIICVLSEGGNQY